MDSPAPRQSQPLRMFWWTTRGPQASLDTERQASLETLENPTDDTLHAISSPTHRQRFQGRQSIHSRLAAASLQFDLDSLQRDVDRLIEERESLLQQISQIKGERGYIKNEVSLFLTALQIGQKLLRSQLDVLALDRPQQHVTRNPDDLVPDVDGKGNSDLHGPKTQSLTSSDVPIEHPTVEPSSPTTRDSSHSQAFGSDMVHLNTAPGRSPAVTSLLQARHSMRSTQSQGENTSRTAFPVFPPVFDGTPDQQFPTCERTRLDQIAFTQVALWDNSTLYKQFLNCCENLERALVVTDRLLQSNQDNAVEECRGLPRLFPFETLPQTVPAEPNRRSRFSLLQAPARIARFICCGNGGLLQRRNSH